MCKNAYLDFCYLKIPYVAMINSLHATGLQIREPIGKLFSLFLTQNICCGYSKEQSR